MGANSLSLPVPAVVVLCILFVVASSRAACFDDCIKSFTEGSSPSAKVIAQVEDCTTKCALGEGKGELKTTTEEPISLDDKLMVSCRVSRCYRRCRAVGGSKNCCARKCHCSLPASSTNDRDQEMTEEPISLDDKLTASCRKSHCYRACRNMCHSKRYCAKKCHCSLPTSSTNDRDQEMTEELISLDVELPKCKYNPCYRACRALGGSKDFCAKKCKCRQLTSLINNDHDQEMTEEPISLDDKLTASCRKNHCYRACRNMCHSKRYCARKCHCSLPASSANDCDQEMMEEEVDDEAASAASE